MPNMVKKSMSIDKELADRVSDVAAVEHKSFSKLVSDALIHLLDKRDEEKMEAAYRAYYAHPRSEEKTLATKLLRLARKTLPKA